MWNFSEKVKKVDSNQWLQDYVSKDLRVLKQELIKERVVSKLQDLKQEQAIHQLS